MPLRKTNLTHWVSCLWAVICACVSRTGAKVEGKINFPRVILDLLSELSASSLWSIEIRPVFRTQTFYLFPKKEGGMTLPAGIASESAPKPGFGPEQVGQEMPAVLPSGQTDSGWTADTSPNRHASVRLSKGLSQSV